MDEFDIALCIVALVIAARFLIRWILMRVSFGRPNYAKVDPDELVTIARFILNEDAIQCQAKIKHTGIRCMIEKPVTSLYSRTGRPCRGIDPTTRVEVRAADAQRALEVLAKDKCEA
ncbi:MAG: hypothetical protein ABFD54_00240 [Armatimonadota bacterium]|nr:hypothetical protein [bacterium]